MMLNAANVGLLSIPTWEFKHVRHGANVTAHRLAKQAIVIREMRVWLGILPSCIHDVLTIDNNYSVE
jgi:hypothetical protein